MAPMRTPPLEVSIPRNSATLRRLTTRSGWVSRCLSEVTRSVPPARISVLPHESERSAVASLSVFGAAYSKDFMAGPPEWLGSKDSPHPGPLPIGWGEGESKAVRGRLDGLATSCDVRMNSLSPSDGERGRRTYPSASSNEAKY